METSTILFLIAFACLLGVAIFLYRSGYIQNLRQWTEEATPDEPGLYSPEQKRRLFQIYGLIAGCYTFILFWIIPWEIEVALMLLAATGFIIPLLWPRLVQEILAVDPNRNRGNATDRTYDPSNWGFFTLLQPGQAKIIERGDRFVKIIMHWQGKMFLGERHTNNLVPNDWDYWRIVDARPGGEQPTPVTDSDDTDDSSRKRKVNLYPADRVYEDSHPLPFPGPLFTGNNAWTVIGWMLYSPLSILWWVWKRAIYRFTGAVFTGIPPFQTVRVYPIDRFKMEITAGTTPTLIRVRDFSDHFRVLQFLFPAEVPSAETQDLVPVAWKLTQTARVFNPYMTAYNADNDWTTLYFSAIVSAVTAVSRSLPHNEVLSASGSKADKLSTDIDDEISSAIKTFGIEVERTNILDITTTDPSIATKLADVAVAGVDRAAQIIRAEGQAAPIRKIAEVLREFPEARELPKLEAMVRAAGAAGDKAIVMMDFSGKGPGQTDSAVLKELRDQRTQKNEEPENGSR